MSQWRDALVEERIKQAKALHEKLCEVGWDNLSQADQHIMELAGYVALERDDVDLESLCDHDFEEDIEDQS